jgi:Cu-Zn family superoxide dismutase
MTRLTQISIWTWCAALAAAAVAVSAADVGAARQSAAAPAPPMTATAVLKDASGATIGAATLTDTPAGVLVKLAFAQGAPAGTHAVHLHAAGRCDPPDFTSAGGHFNPTKASHGFLDAEGPHAGDLPNVHIPADGTVTVEFVASHATLRPSPTSLLDADGTALVMHEGADDYQTDPAGSAESRVACGVVQR